MSQRKLRVGGIILAADSASRLDALRQVIAIDGEPTVRRVARDALAARLEPVVVVVGAQGDGVIACLNNLDIVPVENQASSEGAGGSLAEGVKALLASAEPLRALMVLLANQASIRVGHMEKMLAAHAAAPDRILACGRQRVLRLPCIFPIAYAEELATLQAAAGAESLLQKYAAQVDAFDLPEAFVDADDPDQEGAWPSLRAKPPTDDGAF
jgi:CTP:molybdopterin cytidylyltransferase MocA